MKTKLIKLSLCSCTLAICLSSTLYAQPLLNVKIGETASDYTGGVGGGGPEVNGAYQESAAAVLGSANSWWNEYAYVGGTPFNVSVVDSGDNAIAGVTLTVSNSSGVGTKTTAGTNPNFLFQNGSYQNAGVGDYYTITLAGLAANTEYEFVGYAARTSSSAGATWAVTTGTLDSGTTSNNGTSMDITTGVGKSYSEFFANTDGSGNLVVTDSGNPSSSITVLDGFQLVAVPEPSTIALTLTALGLLAGRILIRRQQNV